MWSSASAQLYLFCALHPKGICHSILLPMIPELRYNHRHREHLHILVLLETESWPCPVLLFWKLSIRRTLPVSQMPLLTQWLEHQEVGRLLRVPFAESHRAVPPLRQSTPHAVFGDRLCFLSSFLRSSTFTTQYFFKQGIMTTFLELPKCF